MCDQLKVSRLVHRLPCLVEGHVKGLINVDNALRLHGAENNGSLNILPRSILSLLKVLRELLDLGELVLDVSSLRLLSKVVGLLLLGGPSALRPPIRKNERLGI